MSILNLYHLLFLTLLFLGGFTMYACFIRKSNYIPRKYSLKKSISDIRKGIKNRDTDDVFSHVGLNFSVKRYCTYRLLVIGILFIFGLSYFMVGNYKTAAKVCVIVLALMLLSSPKETFMKGRKSPFKMALEFLYRKRQIVINEELIAAVGQMRHIILSNQAAAVSSDYIFSRLVCYTKVSKPIWLNTQALIIKGHRDDAANYFKQAYNTYLGNDFAAIIRKMDELPPGEFLQQIEILEETISDKKDTDLERGRQKKVGVVFGIASFHLIVIFIAFIYVSLGDSIRMLTLLY